jgi:uncharacterized protein (TIGR02217 family)
MAFFETEFPRSVGYKATGGPTFNTTVNEGFSGFEQRNRNWALARGKWTVDLMTPPASQFAGTGQQFIDMVHTFFLVVGGKSDAFRFFDHKDNIGLGQQIGVGDGTNRAFQLTKTYTLGGRSYTRKITKPITSGVQDYKGNALTNTVNIYFGGVLQNPATFSVDFITGIVTILGGNPPPANTVIVTADFQFHYPVRFDSDDWQMQVEDSDVNGGKTIISTGNIGLMEVRI